MKKAAPDWYTYSSLTMFRSCPQKFNYGYLQRLEKVEDQGSKAEMNFGSWWHAIKAAEAIERGRSLDSLRYIPDEIRTVDNGPKFKTDSTDLVTQILTESEQWYSNLHPDAQENWESRLNASLTFRLEYMLEEWKAEYYEQRSREIPLAVEMLWKRDLPGLDKILLGYIDEIYLDTGRNITVVRDTKTSKNIGTQNVADDMMDSQLHLYAWGASPVVSDWGYKVKAIAYDRARSVHPKTPKLNISGTLSKSITDFDATTYQRWVDEGQEYDGRKKDKSDAGVYELEQTVLDHYSTPAARSAWFQRTLTPLNKNTIRVHLQAAIDSGKDIEKTVDRVNERGEAARNLTSNCKWCDFVSLCRAQMVGGPDGTYDLNEHNLREKD